jgi:hypothetical protein
MAVTVALAYITAVLNMTVISFLVPPLLEPSLSKFNELDHFIFVNIFSDNLKQSSLQVIVI